MSRPKIRNPSVANIMLRVTPRRKAAYMRWSRRLRKPLSILVREALDREAGYSEERAA